MKVSVKTISSQPSWVIRSRNVELAVTQLGGHMAPVTFRRDSARPVQPYYVSPWQGEGLKIDDPVLVPLRGDFFCAPFGANAKPFRGEKHVCHGEPATAKWTFVSADRAGPATSLTLAMNTKVRPGTVTKCLTLVDGHDVVYCRHVLAGCAGPMPLGHHATLALPGVEGSVLVSTSPIRFGMTNPTLCGNPRNRQYQSFALGERFARLQRVPLLWKRQAFADASHFPAREGFTDILAVFNRPAKAPAWTTAVFGRAGFLWFSLKDPAMLPTTVFWIANRGRHNAPWNGRNRCLGLEDVCGYFAEGIADSARPNALTRAGVPTAVKLSPRRPTAVRYIQGVAPTPRGFGRVARAVFSPGAVTFVDGAGKKATAAVNHEFLQTGEIA